MAFGISPYSQKILWYRRKGSEIGEHVHLGCVIMGRNLEMDPRTGIDGTKSRDIRLATATETIEDFLHLIRPEDFRR